MLEKVVRRRTLADGYLANRRLLFVSFGFAAFYSIQAIIAVGLMMAQVAQEPSVELAILANLVGGPFVFFCAALAVGYLLQGGLLWVARMADFPWISAVVSTISFLFHLTVLFLLMVSVGYVLYSTIAMGDRTLIALLNPFAGSSDWTPLQLILVIGLVCDTLVWLLLLVTTVRRSLRALASSFKKVPGPYSYRFSTVVVSSTGIEEERNYLEDALARARGYSPKEAERIIEEGDRYLLRVASREDRLVAASIHELADLTLVGVFPGVEENELNLSILLEDSYHIQRERGKTPRALIHRNEQVVLAAEKAGWKANRGEALVELSHDEDLYTAS